MASDAVPSTASVPISCCHKDTKLTTAVTVITKPEPAAMAADSVLPTT